MTVAELIAEFRKRTDDTESPYLFSDDDLITWFAQAEEEAALRADLLPDSDTVNVTAGNPVVTIPDGVRHIEYAELRTDSMGYVMAQRTAQELDRTVLNWRTRTDLPREFVHNQSGKILLSALPDRDYTLFIDFYRTPDPVTELTDTPEIPTEHHLSLVHWVEYRAYSVPEAEIFDPARSANGEKEFTRYFGRPLTADRRRKQRSNTPHRTRAHI